MVIYLTFKGWLAIYLTLRKGLSRLNPIFSRSINFLPIYKDPLLKDLIVPHSFYKKVTRAGKPSIITLGNFLYKRRNLLWHVCYNTCILLLLFYLKILFMPRSKLQTQKKSARYILQAQVHLSGKFNIWRQESEIISFTERIC